MSERDYLTSKASRELTNKDYRRKRNRNLAIAGTGLVGGGVLARRGGANVMRALEEPTEEAGVKLLRRGANQSLAGGTASLTGLGFGGGALYRHGQARSSQRQS